MKHHYWEAPIVIYLFLGGLGGGIMCLTAIMSLIVNPGTGSLFFVPMFFALAALAIGCFFLVFELGQPLVFWRVWTTATAIIKWGATLLVIAMFGDIFWLLGYLDVLPLDWGFLGAIASVFGGGTPVFATIAGIAGFGIMVYTGVMLSTLKAHSFWATRRCPCCSPSRPCPPLAPLSRCRWASSLSRPWPCLLPPRRSTRSFMSSTSSWSALRLPFCSS